MTSKGFTLVELLVVLAILSMMAGVVLPSAAVMTRKNQLDTFVHYTAVLCREAFSASVFSGRQYKIELNDQKEIAVYFYENSRWQAVTDLKPLPVPTNCMVDWPADGLLILPEGYCEALRLRFHNIKSLETVFVNVRAYDAGFARIQQ